ncbi:MAG: methionyl-tRNA synthetase, partial [Saprospiraceae bacterium]
NCLQIVTILSVFCEPFIPFSSKKIRKLINLPEVGNGDLQKLLDQLDSNIGLIPGGHQLGEQELLFAKINDRKDDSRLKIIEKQKMHLATILEEEQANQREPIKPEITYDDFSKLDIRTGTIMTAEPVEKADKLLKLTVDIGLETRTVVSGIAKHFKPEEVIGLQVLLLANLAPRKLRGVISQGMILMAEDEKGKLTFVRPGEAWDNGHKIS